MQDLRAIRFIPGTKVSHDYSNQEVKTFSYRELIGLNTPCIGIPCRQNNIIVVDVDVAGATHKKDGREFWGNFCKQYDMPKTYTVKTPSGGYHFYYKLPKSINPDTFSPPSSLSMGVDLKWNGWVGAPPTKGYEVVQLSVSQIIEAPEPLLSYISSLINNGSHKTFEVSDPTASLELHRPFSEAQIKDLRIKIEWLQVNGSLSRAEWRDGLFALKAGIDDPLVLDELVEKWTMNRSYVPGDELQARAIVEKANRQGPIGPGTIYAILKNIALREGAPTIDSPFTPQEIFDRSKVQFSVNRDGSLKVETSESNAAALIGACFDDKVLFHDTRTDLYMFKGKSCSDGDLVSIFLPLIQSPSFGLGLEKFRRASIASGIEILMASRKKDPHLEYLKGLEWDGVPRIEKFFSDYVGVEDNDYHRIVSKNFWTSLAARGLSPGCKFDSMVVLEGHEGIMKSSLVEAIGGEYTFAPSKKDSFNNLEELKKMHQSVIVELPELLGLVNETPEMVKAFLAKPYDHIRNLYVKKAVKSLRGFVFIGTTNSDKYLSAAMGIRRFWPIRIPRTVKTIKLNKVIVDRDQLFAEGIYWYNEGHQYWQVPVEYLTNLVENRIHDEPLIQPISGIAPSLGKHFTSADVYLRLESLGFVSRGLNNIIMNRIDNSLSRLGFVSERDPSQGGLIWQARDSSFGLDSLF